MGNTACQQSGVDRVRGTGQWGKQDGDQGTRSGFPLLNHSTSRASCWTLYIHDLSPWNPRLPCKGAKHWNRLGRQEFVRLHLLLGRKYQAPALLGWCTERCHISERLLQLSVPVQRRDVTQGFSPQQALSWQKIGNNPAVQLGLVK